eukprot:ANDGO_07472.mRNA.1 hypothetical protein
MIGNSDNPLISGSGRLLPFRVSRNALLICGLSLVALSIIYVRRHGIPSWNAEGLRSSFSDDTLVAPTSQNPEKNDAEASKQKNSNLDSDCPLRPQQGCSSGALMWKSAKLDTATESLKKLLKSSNGVPFDWDVKPQFFSDAEIDSALRVPLRQDRALLHVELPFFNPFQHAELFNAMRFNIMEVILFKLASGRQLYEPWMLGENRNASFYEIVFTDPSRRSEHDVIFSGTFLYSDIFDTQKLEALLKDSIVPHDVYYKKLKGRIDLLHTIDDSRIPRMFTVNGRTWFVDKQQTFNWNAPKPKMESAALHGFVGAAENDPLVAFHMRRTNLLGDSPNWHDWPGKFYWHIRSAMEFHDGLFSAAAHAMRVMNLSTDFHYMSFHWRRGDRGHSEMGGFGSSHMDRTKPENVGRAVRQILEQNNLNTVFVATNVGLQADWDAFVQSVAPYRALKFDVANGADPRKENFIYNMVIEQIIAANAELFLSDASGFTMCSTVSRIILEERALHFKSYMKKPLYLYSYV